MQCAAMRTKSRMNAETPVVGAQNQTSPTSSDVHLFPDPKTRGTTYPRLYADCEGLHGGTGDPHAVKDISKSNNVSTVKSGLRQARARGLRRWKLMSIQEGQKSRDWMVKHIYPRILFTFSDVVCYITKNAQYVTLSQDMSRLSRVLLHVLNS